MNRPELLTHPNIPKPLHSLNPRTLLGQKWWDEQRQIAYKKENFRCWACGVHKSEAKYHQWLEAHEVYIYDYEKGTATLSEIVALCHSCHNFIHSGRLRSLYQRGKISIDMYSDILAHGEGVIKATNPSFPPTPTKVADWEKWVLIIDGKEYPGKFRNYEEWMSAYE